MSNYNTLKTAVADVIKTNGNNEITGLLLQQALLTIIDSLGSQYQFAGKAVEDTIPGTVDTKVAYLAGPGTYANFGGVVIPEQHIGILYGSGSTWNVSTIEVSAVSIQTIIDDIIQLYHDSTPVYPLTRAEAVFFGNDTTDILPVKINKLSSEVKYNLGHQTVTLTQYQSNRLRAVILGDFKNGDTIRLSEIGNAVFGANRLAVRYDDEITGITTLSHGEQKEVTITRDTSAIVFIIDTGYITTPGTISVLGEWGDYLSETKRFDALENEKFVSGEIFTEQGFYNASTGAFVPHNSWRSTKLIKLHGKDITGHFYLPASATNGAAIFYDADKNKIIAYYTTTAATADFTIRTTDFPAGAVYVGIVTLASKLDESWLDFGVQKWIVENDLTNDEIENMSDEVVPITTRFKNFGNELFSQEGYYNATNGEWSSSASYRSTKLLEISGDIYARTFLGGTSYPAYGISFYDSDKNFISGYSGTTSALQDTHIAVANMPAGAKYFAISTRNADISAATLVCGWTGAMEKISEKMDGLDDVPERVSTIENEINENYSTINFEKTDKRINRYFDNIPNVSKYYFSLDCARADIDTFRIFKCATDHTGLELIADGIIFGQVVLIERDANKPSLYCQNSSVSGYFDNPVSYTAVISRYTDTVEKELSGIRSEMQSWAGKTIVAFGDSITEFGYRFGRFYMRWSNWVAKITGANVINVAIGGTRLCPRAKIIPVFSIDESYNVGDRVYYYDGNGMECYEFTSAHSGAWTGNDVTVPTYSTLTGYPNLDIYSVIAASCDVSTPIEDRFANQFAAEEYLERHTSDRNMEILNRLASIDWSKVDAVVVMGGTNDWGTSAFGNSSDSTPNSLRGAINCIVSKLLSTYTGIKLYWFTCTPNWQNYEVGQPLPPVSDFSDTFTKDGKTLREVAAVIKEQVYQNHIPVGDTYNEIGWNTSNFPYYFNSADGTHPGRGFEALARYITSKIKSYQTF